MIPYLLYSLGFFVVVNGLLIGCAVWVTRRWTPDSRTRVIAQKTLLILGVLVCMHLLFDLAFLGFVQSDGFGRSVSAKLWKHRHWKPINSDGYRDWEHDDDELRSHRILAVVGDSFVAGHGIDHIEDRFANLLGSQLSSSFFGGGSGRPSSWPRTAGGPTTNSKRFARFHMTRTSSCSATTETMSSLRASNWFRPHLPETLGERSSLDYT